MKTKVRATHTDGETHVARDPHRASAKVQKAVDRRVAKAIRETAKMKSRRAAA